MYLATTKTSYAWDLIELGDITAVQQHYFSNVTDNMPIGSNPSNGYGLGINFVMLDNLYFNNVFKGISDQISLRTFGWEYKLGAKLTSWLDIGYSHNNVGALGVQQDPWSEHEIFIKVKIYEGSKPSPIW